MKTLEEMFGSQKVQLMAPLFVEIEENSGREHRVAYTLRRIDKELLAERSRIWEEQQQRAELTRWTDVLHQVLMESGMGSLEASEICIAVEERVEKA